jgi:aromatic ring-opening dioxygenase catalytic subunit (LigB family)
MEEPFISSNKMSVLFLEHGSPMNAIEENGKVTLFNDKIVAGSLSMISLRIEKG